MEPKNQDQPLVEEAEAFLKRRAAFKRDVATVPVLQAAIERNAQAVINAIGLGFLSAKTLQRLRAALNTAPPPLLDGEGDPNGHA
jgi:hypothetical protein